jgi:hypothetical protein
VLVEEVVVVADYAETATKKSQMIFFIVFCLIVFRRKKLQLLLGPT